jgi:hypothetical protein
MNKSVLDGVMTIIRQKMEREVKARPRSARSPRTPSFQRTPSSQRTSSSQRTTRSACLACKSAETMSTGQAELIQSGKALMPSSLEIFRARPEMRPKDPAVTHFSKD